MPAHSTPRGEASTAQGHGMKVPTPNYKGKHRLEDKSSILGISLGDPKRRRNPGQDYDRDR